MRDEASLYPQAYFTGYNYGVDPKRAEMYRQEHERIAKHKQSGKVLDVGCGMGDFTVLFGQDWEKYGIEISEYAAQAAKDRGICVIPVTDLHEHMAQEYFDLIVFRGTIQHLDHPFFMIGTLAECLKRDGMMVFLATPNADSVCHKLFGTLPALDPLRNWWIPGAKELCNVLSHLGLKSEVYYPYWGSPYARPVSDLLKFTLRLCGVKSQFAFPGNMMEVYARFS